MLATLAVVLALECLYTVGLFYVSNSDLQAGNYMYCV